MESPLATVGLYSVYDVSLELRSRVPALQAQVDALLAPFATPDATPGVHPITGFLGPYNQREVLRSLSSSAVRLALPGQLMEVYQEDERFWVVDDRWGMTEINTLNETWRSWILPRPTIDAVRCAERAVLWPMAQLLRSRSLTLLPAASVAREGRGILLIAPFNIEPELVASIRAGYRIIAQQWTVLRDLRDNSGRLELLHLPGQVRRQNAPALRGATDGNAPRWVDLTTEYPGIDEQRATCEAVAILQPGRRTSGNATELTPERALDALRRAWPIVDLHRGRGQVAMRMAQGCRCCELHLSRSPEDVPVLLDSLLSPARNRVRRFVPAMVR